MALEKSHKNGKTVRISITHNNVEDNFPTELYGHFTPKEFSNRIASINATLNKCHISPTVKYHVPIGILLNGIGAIFIIAYIIKSAKDNDVSSERSFAFAVVAWTLAIATLILISVWISYMLNREKKMRVQNLKDLVAYFNKIDYPREVHWILLIEKASKKSLILELDELWTDVVVIKSPNGVRNSMETDNTLIFDNEPFENIDIGTDDSPFKNIDKAGNQAIALCDNEVEKKKCQANILLR